MDTPKQLFKQGFYQGIGQSTWWLVASAVGFAVGYLLVPKSMQKPCGSGSSGCGCGGKCGGCGGAK